MTLEALIVNSKTGKEEFTTHQVSARMNDDGSYAYYDPNSETGEKIFSGKMPLLKLAEEIVNWNIKFSRKEFHVGLTAFNKVSSSQKELTDSKAEIIHNIVYSPEDINLALATAVRIDDIPLIKELLEDGADPNDKMGGKETPLFLSARSGHVESVRYLLEKSSPENITKSLIGSAGFGQLETSKLLLKKLEEFKDEKLVLNEHVGLALIAAVKGDHPHIVQELLEYKIPNHFLISALHTAFIADSFTSQRMLIGIGVSLDEINNSGMTLLEESCLDLNVERIKKLLDLGANPNANDQGERLFEYIQSLEDPDAYSEIRKLLILSGTKVPDDMQPLAIQTALLTGRHDILRSILNDGANPNLAQVKTMTPLIIAIGKLDLIAIELLLAAGADPKEIAPEGKGNAIASVERMLGAAKSTGDTAKFEKLSAIQTRLNEYLSRTRESPQKAVASIAKDSRVSSNQHFLLACKPKSIETPAVKISIAASLT